MKASITALQTALDTAHNRAEADAIRARIAERRAHNTHRRDQ